MLAAPPQLGALNRIYAPTTKIASRDWPYAHQSDHLKATEVEIDASGSKPSLASSRSERAVSDHDPREGNEPSANVHA